MGKAKSVQIVPEQPHHAAAIDALLNIGFGDNRFGRAVYQLRNNRPPDPRLSWIAVDHSDYLAATIRYWPVSIAADGLVRADGDGQPAALLGPIAVAENYQKLGLGEKIIRHSLALAQTYYPTVILVGPLEYYNRFGFELSSEITIAGLEAGKTVLVI